MIELVSVNNAGNAKILVIGIGGGGNNAVNRMIEAGLQGVTFAAINTDAAVLDNSKADMVIRIGGKLLNGYGAGADPEKGEAAALESEEEIKALIKGYNMAIITCGMGGGTGTGAAPIIAKYCKSEGILTLAVVTKPFSFENRQRTVTAEAGIEKLKSCVDTLLVIPNDKLLSLGDRQIKLQDAFVLCDSVLRYTIEGVTNIVFHMGEINVDFNDLRTTMLDKGIGHIGIGTVEADGSILDAVNQAVNSPLLDTCIEGARNLLINTSGNITLLALNEAINHIKELAGEDTTIIWGTVNSSETSDDKLVVTIIATGMPDSDKSRKPRETSEGQKHKAEPGFTQGHNEVSPELVTLVVPDFLSAYTGRREKSGN